MALQLLGVVKEGFLVSANNNAEKVRELFHEVNVTRIIVQDEEEKVSLEISATVGGIRAMLVL